LKCEEYEECEDEALSTLSAIVFLRDAAFSL
jgi:hypothetical protein